MIDHHQRPSGAQLEPLGSPILLADLPGLARAFDAEAMRETLQAALFGTGAGSAVIVGCAPGQALYPAGNGCTLRYQLDVQPPSAGQQVRLLVTGRVFPDGEAAAAYVSDKLLPLAEQMRGRPEVALFSTPVALIEPLSMAVYAFPIDGGVPTLVAATDPEQVAPLLAHALADAEGRPFALESCAVELAQYGRQNRCTLRYRLTGSGGEQQTVYGKVAADGSGVNTIPIIAALRGRELPEGAFRFNVPRTLGFDPELRLLLLESIPGKPLIKQLLKARLGGQGDASADGLLLEDAIDACARMAAALHSSGIALGAPRTFDDELERLRGGLAAVRRVSPELGAHLLAALDRLAGAGARSEALPLGLAHGDFTYTQLIFAHGQSGLVDFDTICQAEPAIDLGQFLGYQRLAIARDKQGLTPAGVALTEGICQRFLDTYIAAMGLDLAGERQMRDRALLYEGISLLRLALHSWQKLKVSRLDHVITLLEERMSWLP